MKRPEKSFWTKEAAGTRPQVGPGVLEGPEGSVCLQGRGEQRVLQRAAETGGP